MRRRIFLLVCIVAALILGGCTMRTVDKMYCLPRRSDRYNNLQTVMDGVMQGKMFAAPLSGENRQAVQQADLDGDGAKEYILFTKGNSEKPLSIFVFRQQEDQFSLYATIESTGTAFDRVEYVQMDGVGGMELVVGKQVSDQVVRSVGVYTFSDGQAEQLVSANYSYYLTVDLDSDSLGELLVLSPGSGEVNIGTATLYGVDNGVMERSQEVNLSGPVENLRRVITGRLHGGLPAVFVGSTVEESAIITDVFAVVDGVFTNVSCSNESGTSVKTLRNYYVYADDIDNDGEVELPDLIVPQSQMMQYRNDRHYLIRWYAMKPNGSEVDKMYTFHNFVGGWYLQLGMEWANRITVESNNNAFDFYLWNAQGTDPEKVLTVYCFTGQDREAQAIADNRFALYRSESAVYAAHLEVASGAISITQEDLISGFRLIRQDWKTGET